MATRLAFLALATAALAACEQDRSITSPAASFTTSLEAQRAGGDDGRRAADGTLGAAGTVATGGTGTGAALGSQGAVALSDDGRWLFAVNAGSNDVSVFAARGAELTLASRTASGGTLPISVTVHRNLLYVLNAGGDGNISGFSVGTTGGLTPVPGSTRSLSGSNVGPAEVSFSLFFHGSAATEKNTSLLDVYA